MGIYDLYRRLSLESLQMQAGQQAQAYAAEYEGWMRELSAELLGRSAYGTTPAQAHQLQAEIEHRQQHLYGIYAAKVEQLQADVDAQTTIIHQDYDTKDREYDAGMGRWREAPNATPRSPIIDVSDLEHAPAPSYSPRIVADQPIGTYEELPASEESLLSRIAAWFG